MVATFIEKSCWLWFVWLVCIWGKWLTMLTSFWLVKCLDMSKSSTLEFSHTTNVIHLSNFAWWYSLSFTCSYHFQWLLPYFKVTAVSNCVNLKFYVLIQLNGNFWGLWNISNRLWMHDHFLVLHIFKGVNWCVSRFDKNFMLAFSWTLFFRLCIIVFLLGVYQVVSSFLTLTLFQYHMCVKNIHCQFCILDSCPVLFKHCMVATYIKKIMNTMCFVLLLLDITNTFFPVLHLNVSHLSIWSSC